MILIFNRIFLAFTTLRHFERYNYTLMGKLFQYKWGDKNILMQMRE